MFLMLDLSKLELPKMFFDERGMWQKERKKKKKGWGGDKELR